MFLEGIHCPADVKQLSIGELDALASEMRAALIAKISARGGHLASNLGVVELTVALHYVFDSPTDKIVFDVSHQSYCHKMLTGRKDAFLYPEQYDAVSGFSNPEESKHDFFHIGHTSTSISIACGLAKMRDLRGSEEKVIAVIGDGALDGGEAFEGLNLAAEMNTGLIVVVNDNNMSITENCGGLCRHLTALRNTEGRQDNNFFKSLGFDYYFIKNGHDISGLVHVFNAVKDTVRPAVVHVVTQKGKGYSYAEQDSETWHWAQPFDVASGKFLRSAPWENYGSIVGEYLLEKIKKDPDVVMIAAATPICVGFTSERRKAAGAQYIDVGIAEQNAVTFAASIAKRGGKPVFATNSTFIQRAYDQIEQEMCINHCPATMILTHASVYGHSNITHLGLLDIPLLSHIPNLVYLAPANKEEYLAMLEWSIEQRRNPVVIRVPWTGVYHAEQEVDFSYDTVQYQICSQGEKIAILALGGFFQLGRKAAEIVKQSKGIPCTLINPRFITGIDADTLETLKSRHSLVVTIEDGILHGGFGAKIAQYYAMSHVSVMNLGFTEDIQNKFNPNDLLKQNRLTPELIAEDILATVLD